MKKRLLALLLAGVLLGLSACGNKTAEEIKEAGKVATEESKEATVFIQETEAISEQTEDTRETITDTEESGEVTVLTQESTEAGQEDPGETTEDGEIHESAVEQSGEALNVWVNKHGAFHPLRYQPEQDCYLIQIEAMYEVLAVNEDTYPALAKVIDDFNEKQAENAREQLVRLAQMVEENYPEEELPQPDTTYVHVKLRDLYPVRTDKEVFSVLCMDYSHEDKSEKYSCLEAVNRDVQSGKELTLGDIFKGGTDLTTILAAELQENHPTFAFDAQSFTEENLIWTLGYKGVSVYFTGTDSDQPIQISVAYEEYPDIFNGNYFSHEYELLFAEPEGDYIRPLADWENNENMFVVDLYGDGKEDYVVLRCEGEQHKIMVNDNNFLYRNDYACKFKSAYLVKKEGRYYLYIDQFYDIDGQVDIYEITDHSVKYVGCKAVNFLDFADPDCFVVSEYVRMLVENFIEYECYVGPDGMPVPKEEVHSIDRERNVRDYDYVSLVEITAQLVDEQGNLLGQTYTFPAGTTFLLIRTDCETYVDAETGEGQCCRLYVEYDFDIEWSPNVSSYEYVYHYTVNGVPAQECFGDIGFYLG